MTDAPALDSRHTPADLPDRIRHYIDGEFVDSLDGDTFDVLEPVSNEVYVQAAAGKKADIDRAVAAARRAFTDGPWPRMPPRERSRVLHRIADIVERATPGSRELESFGPGLLITQALGQARCAAENFRFFADLDRRSDRRRTEGPAPDELVNRKPIGVALITPWNTPFMLEPGSPAPRSRTGSDRRG